MPAVSPEPLERAGFIYRISVLFEWFEDIFLLAPLSTRRRKFNRRRPPMFRRSLVRNVSALPLFLIRGGKGDQYKTLSPEAKAELVSSAARFSKLQLRVLSILAKQNSEKATPVLESHVLNMPLSELEKTAGSRPIHRKFKRRTGIHFAARDSGLLADLQEQEPGGQRLGAIWAFWNSLSNQEKEKYNERAKQYNYDCANGTRKRKPHAYPTFVSEFCKSRSPDELGRLQTSNTLFKAAADEWRNVKNLDQSRIGEPPEDGQ